MKISELQNILEHYKQENGDLEVRLVIDTHNGEEYNEIINNCIDTTQIYDCPYKCASMNHQFCIPYEGNEYILGTTNYSA